jgi:hypothetical protein
LLHEFLAAALEQVILPPEIEYPVHVKFSVEQTTTAQRGSRGIALLFL